MSERTALGCAAGERWGGDGGGKESDAFERRMGTGMSVYASSSQQDKFRSAHHNLQSSSTKKLGFQNSSYS